MLDAPLPNLVPELRPYQRRAVYWMVQREKGAYEHSKTSKIIPLTSPLCMPLSLIDKSAAIYYNPFRYVILSSHYRFILTMAVCLA